MNGTLHDLVQIYTYWNFDNLFSRIYFGGRLEAFDTVYPDELLGDLLYIFQNKEYINKNQIPSDSNLHFEKNGNYYVRINEQCVLELAEVIANCYPRIKLVDWEGKHREDIVDKIEYMIDILEKKNYKLSKDCLEAFILANGFYYPTKTRILDSSKFGNINLLENELPILQDENSDDFLHALENDGRYTVYCYECDNLNDLNFPHQ